jgi:hypothetical protein
MHPAQQIEVQQRRPRNEIRQLVAGFVESGSATKGREGCGTHQSPLLGLGVFHPLVEFSKHLLPRFFVALFRFLVWESRVRKPELRASALR